MKLLKSTLLALAAVGIFSVGSVASAQGPQQPSAKFAPRFNPNPGHGHHHEDNWYFGASLRPTHHGMQITFVKHGSPAHRAGLERGDVLLKVNGRRPDSHHEMQELIAHSRGHLDLQVRDWRRPRTVFVHVDLEYRGDVHHYSEKPSFQTGLQFPNFFKRN
ncbi:Hypothetical protein PBC10988_24500 [Planctomycetales bacterium 10988]|nr:Hypothetical protein PBC10988_24500 [Planctomycetales bacterium 10988]